MSGGSTYYSTSSDGSNLQTYVSGGSDGKFFVYNAKMLVLANDEFVGYDDFATGWNAAVAATSARVTLFDNWTATDGSFGTGDGFTSGAISVPGGKTIDLDLNGHNINRALTTETSNGFVIEVENGGTLTIQDSSSEVVSAQGKITGGYNSSSGQSGGIYVIGTLNLAGGNIAGNREKYWGGGVYVCTGRTLYMTGGKISDNVANYQNAEDDGGAGGVYLQVGSSLTMTGGEISGNYTCKDRSGGINQDGNTVVTVGGTAVIKGNLSGCTYSNDTVYTTDSRVNNIYLDSNKLITCSTVTPLTTSASIGVTTATTPANGTPVAITGSNSADYSSYFSSDKGYTVANTGSGNAQVVKLATAPLVNAVAPSITTDLSTTDVPYTQGATASALTIAASVSDSGTLSYQWYSNDTNDTTTPTAVGTNSATYTPLTTSAGTTYYYCVVTNTITDNGDGGTKTATTTSNIAKITVNAAASNVMSVDFDGDGENAPTLYTDFADGWAAAIGSSNTTNTTVTLLANWTTTNSLSVPSGKTVSLDLNGKTIKRNLSSATYSGYVISVDGTLTVTDSSNPDTGKITGGWSSDGDVSGINVNSSGTLNLLGGSVTGNQGGPGVMRSGSGSIVVGGTAVVKGNTYDNGSNVLQRNLEWNKTYCSISATTPLTTGAEIHITTAKPTLKSRVKVTSNNVTAGTTANYFKTDLGDEYEVSDAENVLRVKDKTRTVTFSITKDGALYTLPSGYQIEVFKSGETANHDNTTITAAQMGNGVELAVGVNKVEIQLPTSSNSISKQAQTAMNVGVEVGSDTQNITLAYCSLDIKDSTNNLSLMGTTLPLITPLIQDVGLQITPAINRRLVQLKSATMGGTPLSDDDSQESYYEYMTGALDLLGYFMLNQVTGAVVIDIETSDQFPVAADGSDKAVTATNWSTMCDTSWLGTNYDTQTEWSISTPAQLAAFAAAVNSGKDFAGRTVKLTADLDMSGYLWTSIGVVVLGGSSKVFSGTFDGQGHFISGLFQNDLTSEGKNMGAGLFAVNEGTIKSLTVKNSLVASWLYVAGVAGGNMGAIDDVFVENASVFGQYYVGGITATNVGMVKNCGVNAKIVSTDGDESSGGMIASTNSVGAFIQNCWSLGSIEGDCIGGITGENAGTISNCWSAATVEDNRGSISHHNYVDGNTGTIENCYGLAGRDIADHQNNAGTVTGCGTFASATGALTAGTTENCGSDQTLAYGSTNLLTALNGWCEAQGTPTDYIAWVQPSVDAGTYPGFKSNQIEAKASIFSAKFYEPQLWDCQRSPAFPVEGRSFRISGLKAPYDQNLRKISFASSDDYVTFEYVSAVSELPTDVQSRIVSSVKRYTGATEAEIRAGAVVKEVLHSGSGQATETTLSTRGLVWGLGEEGFLYTAMDGAYKYSGGVGTFVSFQAHKSGDSVIYTTEQDNPYTEDQLDNKNLAPDEGKKTAPDSVTYQELIRVVNSSGAAVSGATVKITVNSTVYTSTTKANGYVQFNGLPAQAVTSATVQSGSYATLTYDAVASPEAVLVYANPSGNGGGSQQAKVTVTVSTTGSGTVKYLGAGTGSASPYSLTSGDTAMFSITPADGYEITAATWGGENVLSDAKDGFFSATATADKAFAVTFTVITPTDGIGNVKFTTRNLFDTQRWAAFPQNGRSINFFGLKAPYDNSLHTVTLTDGQYIKFELISSVETAGKTDTFYNSVNWYSGATKQQVGEAAYVEEVLYGSDNVKIRGLGTGMIWAYEDESFGFLFTALDGSYASSAGVGTLFTFKPVAYGSHLALKTDVIKPLPYDAAGDELDWGNYKPIVIPDNGQDIDETYNYSGIILDENGDPESNVEVKIVIGDDTYTTITDNKGRFILPDLPYDGNGELTINSKDIGNVELTDDDTKGFGNDATERTDTGDYTNVFKDDGTTYQKLSAPTYLLTVNLNGGNGGTTGGGYASGASVAINAGTKSGYTFSGWTTSNGGVFASASSANTTFTMPTAATTIAATWTASGGSSSGGVSSTTKADPIYVDGTEYDIGTQTVSGDKTTVTVDQPKLQAQIDKASESVLVPVGDKTNTAVAQLVVKNVEDMAKKDMTLSVRTGDVTYQMPTTAVDTETLMTALGATDPSKVPISVTITNLAAGSETTDKGTVVLNPVEFSVTAAYGGKTVEVERFDRYVQRIIELPVGYDASKITTAIRADDGEHVPTQVYQKDGKYYAKINSLTNSTYVLILNQQSFADASGKWYAAAADEMASRCVIFGRSNGKFDGEANVTRAEFAAMIVRALGLPETGDSNFSDVSSTAWCAGAIGAASEYGIIYGYTDGSFRPNQNITRQEAMAILQRAAKVAEFAGSTGSLSAFSDAGSVGAWAKEAVAFNVGSGLIVGKSNGTLSPLSAITRAETAVTILRLLQKAELVDVRSKT
ncbi:MAG: S-layer homology domain-containing protein [Oscillospiraceae bacterium]|nr:S-layer homology domain-containing protein [Oscillospiraceae bacterium]